MPTTHFELSCFDVQVNSILLFPAVIENKRILIDLECKILIRQLANYEFAILLIKHFSCDYISPLQKCKKKTQYKRRTLVFLSF